MTKEELELIKGFLDKVPGCMTKKDRETCPICISLAYAKRIVAREINIKTMDPRKD